MRPAHERVLSRTVQTPDGCWLYAGARTAAGYGKVSVGGYVRPAHRVVFEALVGPVASGLELDHVAARGCTSKSCVNPAHLEPVTHGENVRRAHPIGRSGYRGVCRHRGRWQAAIRARGATVYLGSYEAVEVAAEVARRARMQVHDPAEEDRLIITSLTMDQQMALWRRLDVLRERAA